MLEYEGDFEPRQDKPQIVAETLGEGDLKDVGNEGFRRLDDSISGKSRKQRAIPLTAPVNQQRGRKMAGEPFFPGIICPACPASCATAKC